jgi:hypothetical protein
VINLLMAEMWPNAMPKVLESMKQHPFQMGPYELHLLAGEPGPCPLFRNIAVLPGEPGSPVRFTCDFAYEGTPALNTMLIGCGWFGARLLPKLQVQLHWLSLRAPMHVELSVAAQTASFFFLREPVLCWKLEILGPGGGRLFKDDMEVDTDSIGESFRICIFFWGGGGGGG